MGDSKLGGGGIIRNVHSMFGMETEEVFVRILWYGGHSPCLLQVSKTHGPRRTLPPPYPLLHTSGQMLAWHTSGQTCGPDEPRPQQ